MEYLILNHAQFTERMENVLKRYSAMVEEAKKEGASPQRLHHINHCQVQEIEELIEALKRGDL